MRGSASHWLLVGAALVAAGHVPLVLYLFAAEGHDNPLLAVAGLGAVAAGLVAVGVGLIRLAVAFGRDRGR